MRAPSDTTNGASSSKGTSHSKGQRSTSSTYHRQRRHSDFCEYGLPLPRAPPQGPSPTFRQGRLTGKPPKPAGASCRGERNFAERCWDVTGSLEVAVPSRARKGLGTGNAPGADTRCFMPLLCSSGFSFLSYLSHLIFFPVSQPNPSLFWRPATVVAWNPFGPLVRHRAPRSASTWDLATVMGIQEDIAQSGCGEPALWLASTLKGWEALPSGKGLGGHLLVPLTLYLKDSHHPQKIDPTTATTDYTWKLPRGLLPTTSSSVNPPNYSFFNVYF